MSNDWRVAVLAAVALVAGRATAADPSDRPPPWRSTIDVLRRLEGVEMLSTILADQPIGAGTAWFHPGQSKYGWKWLARMDADHDGAVTLEEFAGSRDMFERLDRDRDGRLTPEDFDWSTASPYWRQLAAARQLLRRADADGDGKLSAGEWQSLFDQTARGKDKLTADDIRAILFPPAPKPTALSADPSQGTLLVGLLDSEIGSVSEGPAVGRPAPDFTLRTPSGKEISLEQYRGGRPLVLVFGNYTCGPFRRTFGAVEEVKKRYDDQVAFLGVYVREAHPTTGWRMESNDREGVCFPQPQTDADRTKIAEQCQAALKMTMPLVVDEIDDRVGHLYSGMPSRLYVIGRDGRIMYKSGRGPFGFLPGEMEQALVMHLVDQAGGGR